MPELFVNVTAAMETKLRMLGCHESQRRWLNETQGLDDYLESMRQSGAEVAGMSGRPGWQYAEGFRRHSHVGFSAQDRDLLAEVLGDLVLRPATHADPKRERGKLFGPPLAGIIHGPAVPVARCPTPNPRRKRGK